MAHERIAARVGRRACATLLALCAACPSGPGPSPSPPPAPRETIEPLVARDAVLFDPGTVPAAVVDRLAGARVVLLGEIHWVQEHQDFLVLLLARLQAAGFRWIVQEQMHATAWTGEEYAMLRSDALPVEVTALSRTLLDGVRALNAGLPDAERMHFAGFDMNHGTGLFPTALRIFQQRFGAVPQLDALLSQVPDSPRYAAALDALPAALEADAAAISATIGADRYAQLLELVGVERQSLPLRARMDYAARELVIRERISRVLSEAGQAGVAVNCGLTHARKTGELLPWETIGTWLAGHPEAYGGDPGALRSVVFLGARGERLLRLGDPAPVTFDATSGAPPNDLVRILAERAGALGAWLPFDDPLFSTSYVELDVGGTLEVLRPGAEFDAVVLYPDVSVLSSIWLMY